MNKVAILMSTYNGEKYINEQIESIFHQEEICVELYIRDDGSTDSTLSIIQSYIDMGYRINLIKGSNIGPGKSFMTLLYSVENKYDYYAFSDQDDIWDKRKIIMAIKKLEKSEKRLYCSNQTCINEKGEVLFQRYIEQPRIDLRETILKNKVTGCTMVFDCTLFSFITNEKLRPNDNIIEKRLHDNWIASVAALFDTIIYDHNSYIMYRQHSQNVVGANKSMFKKLIPKVTDKSKRKGRSILAKELLGIFPDKINDPFIYHCAYANNIKSKIYLIGQTKMIKEYSGEPVLYNSLKIAIGLF